VPILSDLRASFLFSFFLFIKFFNSLMIYSENEKAAFADPHAAHRRCTLSAGSDLAADERFNLNDLASDFYFRLFLSFAFHVFFPTVFPVTYLRCSGPPTPGFCAALAIAARSCGYGPRVPCISLLNELVSGRSHRRRWRGLRN
jgi:hypothetical protein